MVDMEQNLDAYRILAQILGDLRSTVREELEKRHGNEWFRVGLPPGVLDRLIERKEKEKAIDWYESEYQQLIDFATFGDLLEIIEHDGDLVPHLRAVAPSPPLLHARLLELEVMREKLALARAVSESELSFLGTFHLRFQQALLSGAAKADVVDLGEVEPSGETPQEQAEPAPEKTPEKTPEKATGTKEAKDTKEAKGSGKKRPKPSPEVQPPAPEEPAPAEKTATGEVAPPAPEPATDDGSRRHPVEQAMDQGDNVAVLRALYREVTTLAEELWKTEAPPSPAVWNRVRVHSWYQDNFSDLGLKPLSDFYDIIGRVYQRMENGLAKDELQELLRENNFAKVLLELRDMFKKNQI